MRRSSLRASAILIALLANPLAAADPFAAGVRQTAPLTPADEQASFRLPPGFAIQLVAAEPDIQKPLNLAFDARGRIWVTDTVEYPYPAPADRPGRDSIKILEDTNGDGRADRITTFADGLNIPMGLVPYRDGVIAFSIPNIWYLADKDGDGRCDHREVLYGPFDTTRDTHGMCNAFRRGYDGWLYACHGFNNQSKITSPDGHVVEMHSGNTFRLRTDGARLEHYTHGQVNPFGMTCDEWGNFFTADCHSKPIYQLLRGGYYPSFGRPDDGLGFVPPMMNHLHGSTAIAGVVYYQGENFPAAFRGQMLSGNVMTSRINRNALKYHGSTISAHEQPDFLSTTDPWFRPVDLQVGPDGALYVADFYNRIIGHYEVPLNHPQRDRERGRIWRIVYQGEDPQTKPATLPPSLADASTAELIKAFENPVLGQRLRAADELVDRIGADCVSDVRDAWKTSTNPLVRLHAVWVLYRLAASNEADVRQALADGDPRVRTHALKILAETPDWSSETTELVHARLADDEAFVRRAAAEALGLHPAASNVQPLLELTRRTPAEDHHLMYMARRALREQLRSAGAFAALGNQELNDQDRRAFADLAALIDSPEASDFLLVQLQHAPHDLPTLSRYVEQIADNVPLEKLDRVAELARARAGDNLDAQLQLFRSLHTTWQRRGHPLSAPVAQWGEQLAQALLTSTASTQWTALPSPDIPYRGNPWAYQSRTATDGQQGRYLGSLAIGEEATGVLRSPTFAIPARLSFYLAGHVGLPNRPSQRNVWVRLRSAADDKVLAEVEPPRNDTAHKIEWDLSAHASAQGYLELVDENTGTGYAWLALGRLEPAVVALPEDPGTATTRAQSAAQLAGELKLESLRPTLIERLKQTENDPALQQAFAQALVALTPDSRAQALAARLGDAQLPKEVRTQVVDAITTRDETAIRDALASAFRVAPQRGQAELAQALLADRAGAETLLHLAEQGQASARLLARPAARERFTALQDEALARRATALTENLPSENQELQKLIATRAAGFAASGAVAERGAAVFQKHCAACHQLGGQGALVGPQLDGIGGRGVERVVEDLLDPNRNVDVAFRTTTLITDEGQVLTGLARRTEGTTLIFVNDQGQEFRVPQGSIDQQRVSTLSLMPDNVASTLTAAEFYDLLAHLLAPRK